MKRKTIDAGLLAALNAGAVSPEGAAALAASTEVPADAPAGATGAAEPAPGATGATAAAEPAPGATGATAAAEPAPGATAAAEPAVAAKAPVVAAADPALVTHLKEELATVRTESTATLLRATTAEAELKTAKETVTVALADVASLSAIVLNGCKSMAIALNASTAGVEGFTAKQLTEFHTKLSADCQKRFPIGGVATTTAAAQAEGAQTGKDGPSATRSAGVAAATL